MHMRKLLLTVTAFLLLAGSLLAQRTVTGKVTDDKGNPIPNASILVKGTVTGTVTKADGTYSLVVPATGKAIIASAVDMMTVEKQIGSQTELNFSLAMEDKTISEVVVVGYGTQRRKAVTAAIGKVDAEPIARLVTPSLDKQLGGRTAGVLVTNSSGLVNQAPRIRIRGFNSISGGRSPLIVVDGTPVTDGGFSGVANTNALTDINPNDVESIEVLKDGSATAIYGSRASNGVILITTKKGRAGRSNVNYGATFGFAKPYNRFELLNGPEFVTIANEKFTNAGQAAQAFMNSENTSTDWQDYLYNETSNSQSHNLSIDGGNDRSNYFVSFNFTDQEGMVITNKVRRYAVRANLEHRANKWLKFSNNITLSRTEDNDQNNGGNALSGAVAASLRALPNVRIFNPDLPQFDYYNILPNGAALGQDANLRPIENNYSNIGFVLAKNKFESKKHRILNNFTVEVKPFNWITWTTKAGIDYYNGVDFQALDNRHGDGRGSNGVVFNQSLTNFQWVVQNYANLAKSFGSHNLNATLGHEVQNSTFNSFSAQGSGISDLFFIQENIISNSYATQFSGGGYNEGPGFISYFARVNYDYKNKYFAQVTYRRDGLSRFSEENRFGNFPGFSLGWRISEESFWKNSNALKFINEFKLRGSWARVGNDNIAGGLFPYLSQYGSRPYGALSGIAISLVGNTDLQWEQNEKLDIGADITFWNNRMNFSFDWFKNKNNDLVLAAPLPVSFGVPGNSIFQNIGDMENKGFEISLGGQVIKGNDLTLDVSVNYTNVKNKVLSLYLNQDVIGGYNILRVNEPINALYGYQFAGVNSGNGNPMYYKADGTLIQGNIANTTYYGVIKEDDPTLGAQTTLAGADRRILGNVLPTWFGGVSTSLRYKGFALDMMWRYSGGNYVFNLTKQEALMNQAFQNNGKEILNRWTTAGQVTDVPRLWYGRDNFTNLQQNANSRFVEKGDFAKLDNLTLTYNVNSNLLSRISNDYVKSFRFFVQGQNLVLITDYSGIDPENITEGGIDNNTVPQPRIISVGFNIGL